MRWRAAAARAGETVEDLIFPRRCPVCDRPVRPFGSDICPECEASLHPLSALREALCCCCGKPLKDPGREYCSDCAARGHVFQRGCAVYRYREISGSLYRFKYEGRAEYARFYGRKMASRFEEEFDFARVDALIPVPVSRDRMRTRGYNQAALLAREIGGRIGVTVRENLLERVIGTQALRGMSAQQRRESLKNAFIASGDDVKSKVYVLIDDIYTTGATMDACSRELCRAGAAGVFFLTLAVGEDPERGQDDR